MGTILLSGIVYFTPYIIKDGNVIVQESPYYSVVVSGQLVTVSSNE